MQVRFIWIAFIKTYIYVKKLMILSILGEKVTNKNIPPFPILSTTVIILSMG